LGLEVAGNLDLLGRIRGDVVKIVRFFLDGKARFGILESGEVYPCAGDPFAGLKPQSRAIAAEGLRLLSPVEPPNVVCIGLNYRRHIEEAGASLPKGPQIFLKPTTAVCGPEDPIFLPLQDPDRVDYEVELAIVIGKRAKHVSEQEAPNVVLGYTVANDVSARGVQFADAQWTRGKSFDSFCPLGPCIETELEADRVDVTCRVNGRTLQHSNTSDMIRSPSQLVSFVSGSMTLLPGTVILTGTPEGVGFPRRPPIFLREGDVVECEVEGIGILRNPVVAEQARG
jgi:2-keto-4-pentenoate hydratase/2-oxohepta-3-ene-1,7-dioic acid hydratase in catechol pathway